MSYLVALSHYLPEQRLTNEQLAQRNAAWNADEIFKRTGIKERRIARHDQTAADLAILAAQKLFSEHPELKTKIDALLFCCQSPDYITPATACWMQHQLGLSTGLGAFDYNLSCSGFPCGLWLARALVESSSAKCVLLLVADTISKFCNPLDLVTSAVFADGAAAAVIAKEAEKPLAKVGISIMGSDGSGMPNLIIPAGGARQRCSPSTCLPAIDDSGNQRSQDDVFMNGPEIFNFAISAVPKGIENLLKVSGLTFDQVDMFLMHQANAFILEVIRKKLKVSPEKMPSDISDIGNTAGASLPILLSRAFEKGLLKTNMQTILAGYGAGYAWAMTHLIWLTHGATRYA